MEILIEWTSSWVAVFFQKKPQKQKIFPIKMGKINGHVFWIENRKRKKTASHTLWYTNRKIYVDISLIWPFPSKCVWERERKTGPNEITGSGIYIFFFRLYISKWRRLLLLCMCVSKWNENNMMIFEIGLLWTFDVVPFFKNK